jgi:hypothetical protein
LPDAALAERFRISADLRIIVAQNAVTGVAAGYQHAARLHAARSAPVELSETGAIAGDSINVRRVEQLAAAPAEIAVAEVVR